MKILIAGDYCPIGRNAQIIEKEEYVSLFNGFENLTKQVDYSIVNLECPITVFNERINKTGPCIKTEDTKALAALKFAGFDLLTLANNHIQDYGSKGVKDTLKNAHDFGFETVGAADNLKNAKKPFIKEIQGIKVGVLNVAENEFCAATDQSAGAYTFNLIDNLQEVKLLKQKVDKLILIYHGGREHYQLPSPELRKRFRFFIENGVDAIVAHHTHCFSGYEYYNNKPIVYSLGNFIFDYKKKYQKGIWTEGMSVILNLVNNEFTVELIPHFQGRENDSTLHLLENENKKEFLNKIDKLNAIISDDTLFMEEWDNYIKSQEKFYLSSLYIKNIYFRMLFIKGFLPISLLRNKHNKLILNLMRCEAHREIMIDVLSNELGSHER
ncbi:CapA family protein [Chryseobacterium sp. POL2]|uniref:CapA family protein n=1 Tax=Chryseobacterium sp. POL2 TaxID=2713414 RepID=UPI0013E0EC25|nr:CapA family protein [Chryseobacterium sp. POL2]QIG90346.1 CapA family protein [Chryseobacterium sp. POL2]